MTKKLKVHKALLGIHATIFMFSTMIAWLSLIAIKYSTINSTMLTILAVSQFVISAYAAYTAVRYENSIMRIRKKLGQ